MTKRLKCVLLCILVLTGMQIFGQELSQTVRGTVVDSESKQPLIGANVVILGSTTFIGASTDIDGNFKIANVPVGRHDIKVTYLGYEEQVASQVLVSTGKEAVLNFELQEALNEMQTVVVTDDRKVGEAQNEMASVSARSFSIEQTERFAATGDDPSRLALSFAGVRNTDDILNEIVIRGNSPRGLLWKLEGVEIPSPNHLTQEGGGAGSISMLSNNVLGTSDFYTGAFPAEYGNALSGIFDLKYKKGNNEKREYAIQLGTLGLDAALEGPFSKNGRSSYLVNYRYSTLAVIEATGYNIQGDLNIGFQDLNFHLFFPMGKSGYLSFWGLGGLSTATIEDSQYFAYNKLTYTTENVSGYNMGATGLSYSHFFNDKIWMKFTTSASGYNVLWKYGYLDTDGKVEGLYRSDIINYNVRNAIQVNNKFNAKNSLRSGIIVSQMNYSTRYRDFTVSSDSKETGRADLLQAYTQWKHRFNRRLTLMSGLHYTHFMLNNSYSIEPRLGLNYELTTRDVINVGSGIHSRMEPLGTYMVTFWDKKSKDYMNNSHLELTKAMHAVLGYTHFFTDKLNAKVETYFQYLYDVPIMTRGGRDYSVINENENYAYNYLVNKGLGKNYGVELTVEKGLANNWYLLSTLSFYNSLYMGHKGVWKSTRYNGKFISNLTAGKEFKVGKNKDNILGLNTRVLWSGGKAYIPIDLEASQLAQNEVKDFTQGFADFGPNYFRLDASISYRRNKPSWAWQISFDVQNATNRKNEVYRKYKVESNTIESKSHMGILPVLKYRVEF